MIKTLIASSALILALLLLRRVFRNVLSRRVQYALWGLVLVRLLLPVDLPAVNFSILTVARPVEEAVVQQVADQPVYVPVARAPLVQHPAAPDTAPEQAEIPAGNSAWLAADDETAVEYRHIPADQILSVLWWVGMAAIGIFFIMSNLRFYRRLRRCRRHFVPEAPASRRVYVVPDRVIPSPCLFGNAIYLTASVAEDPARLGYVLAHEEAHARHLDPLWSLLRCVCLTVYWFDPLVWVASACARTDCELACDEAVLARIGEEERLSYGQALLSLIPVKRSGSPLLTATSMTAGKRQLKDRITRIAHRPRQLLAAALIVALLAGVLAACTFTGGAAKPVDETVEQLNEAYSPRFNAGEPVAVIPLDDLKPYVPPVLENDPALDFTGAEVLDSRDIGGHNVVLLLNEEGEGAAAVREGEDLRIFLTTGLSSDPRMDLFYNVLGRDGFTISYGGEIDFKVYGTYCDYFYLTDAGEPVLLARTVNSTDEPKALDLNGDGTDELVTETECFFLRDGVLYRADLKALVAEHYHDLAFWEGGTWDTYSQCLNIQGWVPDSEGKLQPVVRYLYFDGENRIFIFDEIDIQPAESLVEPPLDEDTGEDISDRYVSQSHHSWAGSGIAFTSKMLGVTIELPPEWDAQVAVYDTVDETGQNIIRIDVLEGWDDADPNSGHMGSIYRFSKNDWEEGIQSPSIPDDFFEHGSTRVMLETNDSVFVLKLSGDLVKYKNSSAPGFEIYQEIENQLLHGEYEISMELPYDNMSSGMEERYKAILLGDGDFVNIDRSNQAIRLSIENIKEVVSGEDWVTAKASKFTIIDLDGNGENEIVLWIQTNERSDYGFEILYFQDQEVYGFTLPYRGFMHLKTDGTFYSSGGMDNREIRKLQFSERGYTIEDVSDGESQEEKADVEWYDLTSYNVELAFEK